MSELLGCLTDELGGADEALALAAFARSTAAVSGGSAGTAAAASGSTAVGSNQQHAPNPAHAAILKRSKQYYTQRKEGQLVGLDNQGATCYLNSLLQALYLTPEFRQLLFDLNDEELGLSHYLAHEAAEAEKLAALERMSDSERAAHRAAEAAAKSVEVSEERVAEFTAMGMDRVNVVRTLRKFPLASQNEEAMEYLFSHDFASDPPEPAAEESAASSSQPKKRLYKRVPIEFRRFFAQLQLGTQQTVGTEGITRSFGWDSKEGQASVQHDIQELYIRLMEALSGSIAGCHVAGAESAEKRMDDLFKGSMCTRTTCSACGNVSLRTESLYNFTAHVKGLKNLRDSLGHMVAPELLEGPNAYFCHSSQCKKKVKAWRQDSIASLPPLLTFALNRHEYNKKTWARVKVNDKLAFPMVLDMRPYTTEAATKSKEQLEEDEATEKAKLAQAKDAASSQQQPQSDLDVAIANSLKSPAELQADAAAAAATAATAAAASSAAQVSASGKGKKSQQQQNGGKKGGANKKGASSGGPDNDVDSSADSGPTGIEPSVFDPASPLLYDLFAVIVHAGGAHGGHYFAYAHDVVAHAQYVASHPEARGEFDAFVRDPYSASASAAPGQKAASYSGDQTKSAHPSFWYELNDSNVSPVSFDKIATQYGGGSKGGKSSAPCAYILMYRRRGMDDAPLITQDGAMGPAVPQSLRDRVEAANKRLAEEREIYDKLSNQIEIELHDERQFSIHAGQLYPAGYDPVAAAAQAEADRVAEAERRAKEDAAAHKGKGRDAEEEDGFGLMNIFANEDEDEEDAWMASVSPATSGAVVPASSSSSFSSSTTAAAAGTSASSSSSSDAAAAPLRRRFVVDRRITVPQLYAQVREFLAAENSPAAIPDGKLVLNQLTLKHRPPHQVEGYLSVDDPADAAAGTAAADAVSDRRKKSKPNPKTLEQLGFSSLQHLLLWNGSTINSVPFATGTKQEALLTIHCVLFGPEAVDLAQKRVSEAPAASDADDAAAQTQPPLSLLPSSSSSSSSSVAERAEFFLPISPLLSASALASLLSSRLELPAERTELLYMHPVSKVLKPLPQAGSDESQRPLKVLGIVNHAFIGIELRAAPTAAASSASSTSSGAAVAQNSPLARAYFGELQQRVRLVVINALPSHSANAVTLPPGIAASAAAADPSSNLILEGLQKSSTIAQLKAHIHSLLLPAHPELDLSSFRLRKIVGLTKAGPLLLREEQTLTAAGLNEDDMHVRAEYGPLPDMTKGEIDVLVTIVAHKSMGGGGAADASASSSSSSAGAKDDSNTYMAKVVDRVPFMAQASWSVKETKAAMLAAFGGHGSSALAGRNENAFCLYRGHAQGYDEHGKPFSNEFMTLGAMHIEQSSALWMEQGPIPTSGMVQLEIVLLTPTAPLHATAASAASSLSAAPVNDASSSPLLDPTLSMADWRSMQQPLSPYTPAAATSAVTAAVPVGDTAAASADTAVSSSSSSSSSAAAAGPSEDVSLVIVPPRASFLLSPLFTLPFCCTDSLLELKQALLAYPGSPLSSAGDTAHLRVRLATRMDTPGKWLNADEKTLKKQGISSNKKLLVQVLPADSAGEENLSAGAMLLRVCTAVPAPDSGGGGVRVGPAALQEVLFDDGEHPQLPSLTRLLARTAGMSEAEGAGVGVLKWIGAGKDTDGATDKPSAESGSAAASSSAAVASPAPAATAAVQGWVVLFPEDPNPAPADAGVASTDAQKGAAAAGGGGKGQKGGQQKQKQGQQQPQGGKGGKQGRGNAASGNAASAPPPAWTLRSGPYPLHEDDVLLVVSLGDFACASLADLSALARSWPLGSVLPPGYTAHEKQRAEEIEWERRMKVPAPKRKEVELKIEY